MRRAFTLIELLLVVAILATMVTVGVAGLNASRASIGTFAATRDVMAIVRRARSVALVTQKPVVVEYSVDKVDDEVCAKVEIHSETLFKSKPAAVEIRNLDGEIVSGGEDPVEREGKEAEGETLAEILSPKGISGDVAKGLRIRASANEPENFFSADEVKKSKISIYSTADSVVRSYAASDQPVDKVPVAAATGGGEKDDSSEENGDDGPFKAVFAANGTVDPPHRIWIYPDGSTPDKGLCITVDRFGEPRCEEVDAK